MARYISVRQLRPGILKPVGATSLYLAIKIMEDNPPNAEEFADLFGDSLPTGVSPAPTDHRLFSRALHRNECIHGLVFFFDNITRAANALTAARGIAALTMMKYEFHTYLPSLMAQCCLKAAEHILGYNSLVELPSDHPSHIMQKCLRKTLLLASANKDFLTNLCQESFLRYFQSLILPPPSREEEQEPRSQPGSHAKYLQKSHMKSQEPVRKPSKTSAKRPNKEAGAKEPAIQPNKSAKRPKIEASANDPKGRTAAETVAPTRRTARNTQRCFVMEHTHTHIRIPTQTHTETMDKTLSSH
ncbi:cyclin-O protein B-like [Xenopus laevis]|uniref:Cyclin-O protein B-like n=2 Tax=Xenopus laevis TaxID=8355 RepID=A0A1L8GWH8_XENLA|nr:cyclin-O protein B-like [Xenopus laevis]XP_041441377.1 cyclin-O protein B-like [Xenopus laevis]XP_041441378.1 cyclin-O protein B-like [Xenopus laevis]OCT88180.1 hypothetical protein XELAEV_18016806mg [Xenopus laevis]